MNQIPLSQIPLDDLLEIQHLAKQEYALLARQHDFAITGDEIPLTDVFKYLALHVAVAAIPRKKAAEEFWARPWYRRLFP